MGKAAKRKLWKSSGSCHRRLINGITIDQKAINNYFCDLELYSWIYKFWGKDSFSLNGNIYGISTFLFSLQRKVSAPNGFDSDWNIEVVLSRTETVTMGGINMETGILWINPSFPNCPRESLKESRYFGIYSYINLPDWKKSLIDFVAVSNQEKSNSAQCGF